MIGKWGNWRKNLGVSNRRDFSWNILELWSAGMEGSKILAGVVFWNPCRTCWGSFSWHSKTLSDGTCFFLCNVKTYGLGKPSRKGVVSSNIGNFMEVAVVNCTQSQPLHSLSRFSSTYLHTTLGVNIPCHRTEGWSVESEPQPKFVGYIPILHPPLFDEHLLARERMTMLTSRPLPHCAWAARD